MIYGSGVRPGLESVFWSTLCHRVLKQRRQILKSLYLRHGNDNKHCTSMTWLNDQQESQFKINQWWPTCTVSSIELNIMVRHHRTFMRRACVWLRQDRFLWYTRSYGTRYERYILVRWVVRSIVRLMLHRSGYTCNQNNEYLFCEYSHMNSNSNRAKN